MYCHKCGQQTKPQARYCSGCGANQGMNSISQVSSQINEKKPTTVKWLISGVVLFLICVLVIPPMAASWYFDSHITNAPGDKRCDYCGDSLIYERITSPVIKTYNPKVPIITRKYTQDLSCPIYENGRLIHEYCAFHYMVYGLLHPVKFFNNLETAKNIKEQQNN